MTIKNGSEKAVRLLGRAVTKYSLTVWNCMRFGFYLINNLKVLTKDSVTVSVDAVLYYRISNATTSVTNVENAHHSTRLLAQTTLRNTMGIRHLHEILSERVSISGAMLVLNVHHRNE